jgi:plastocyanin
MPRRRLALSALALVLAAGVAGACGGDGDDDGGLAGEGDESSSGPEVPDDLVVMEGMEVEVEALDNTFRAQDIQISPGATVIWTNEGRNDHDVLPTEGDDWGVEVEGFAPGDVYEHTFETPGVYSYYCSIHGTTTAGMIGTVVVE